MTPIYLQEDPYGQLEANKFTDEEHVLVANRPVRSIVLDYGAFFSSSSSLVVKNKATGATLTRGVHYTIGDIYKKQSMRYGSEICGTITILDATIAAVLVSYRAFGGALSFSNKAFYANVGEIELDDKPVDFKEIIGKPARYTPLPHLHDAGDLFGLEYIVRGLEEVRDAILLGDKASHDEVYRDIEYFRGLTQDKIDDLRQRITDHLADFNNPHQVTAYQAGTYTKQETQALLSAADQALRALVTALEQRMTAHFENYTNAHGTTPAMLGGITKAQFDAMLLQFQKDMTAGSNGHWDIIYSGNGAINPNDFTSPYGTMDGRPIAYLVQNTSPFAQYFLVSCNGSGGGPLMNFIWVDGLLISDSIFAQQGDPKNQLTVAYVPSGSTLYVSNGGNDSDAGAVYPDNIYVSRWTRQ